MTDAETIRTGEDTQSSSALITELVSNMGTPHMSDPARIARMLERIERLWMESPDLRLGQLLYATCPALERHLFYTEDDVLEQALEVYEQQKQQEWSEKTP